MTTPKQYSDIDAWVYNVDVTKGDNYLVRADNINSTFVSGGQTYQVLKTVDTNDLSNSKGDAQNGFQGMVVAPVVNGKPDKSQAIVAYAGTNAIDWSGNDIDTDIRNVVFGSKTYSAGQDSQFTSAEQFYQEVSNMPDVKVDSTTGHSLGGALAQKVAATHHLHAVTFSTAGVGSQLTAEEKAWITGEGKASITNFMHKNDQVSAYTDAKSFGTAVYAGDFGGGGLLSGHFLTSYSFSKDGNVNDQSGVEILTPQLVKAVKSSYKKVVMPKIKELKVVLASGGVSGTAKIALETELVSYTAQALRAKAVNWYETCIKEVERMQKDYQNKEDEMIQSCRKAGGPMMFEPEAKSIYHEISGYMAYQEYQFTDLLQQIKEVYHKELKVADQMEKLVAKTLENDQSLAGYFR